MSLGVFRKLLRGVGLSAFLWLAMPTSGWAQLNCAPCAPTFGVPCGVGCQTHHCPPAFKYCYEGGPRIHWTRGCPHPICNPCDLPHWGFYETCWSPWPFPPNWTHCPTPPPAAFVTLNPYGQTNLPANFGPRGNLGSPQSGGTYQPQGQPMTLPPTAGPEELAPPRRFEEKRPGFSN